MLRAMKLRLTRKLAIGAAFTVVVGAGALSWIALRAPMHWPIRLLGAERAASLRVRLGVIAAHALGRRPVIMIGDSRFDQLGFAGLGTSDELVVCAGFGGATARGWNAVLSASARSSQPATFVVWLGVNDLVNEVASGGDATRHLEAIIDRLARATPHRVLVLEQIPVRLPASPEQDRVAEAVVEINRALAALTARFPKVELVPLWARFGGGAPAAASPCRDCYADALHLSEHGDAVLRALLAGALRGKP